MHYAMTVEYVQSESWGISEAIELTWNATGFESEPCSIAIVA